MKFKNDNLDPMVEKIKIGCIQTYFKGVFEKLEISRILEEKKKRAGARTILKVSVPTKYHLGQTSKAHILFGLEIYLESLLLRNVITRNTNIVEASVIEIPVQKIRV